MGIIISLTRSYGLHVCAFHSSTDNARLMYIYIALAANDRVVHQRFIFVISNDAFSVHHSQNYMPGVQQSIAIVLP